MTSTNFTIQAQNDPFAAFTLQKFEEIVTECKRDGRDPYRASAAFMHGVLYENVTPAQREVVKRLVFVRTYSSQYMQQAVIK